jgi:hypothetical protein
MPFAGHQVSYDGVLLDFIGMKALTLGSLYTLLINRLNPLYPQLLLQSPILLLHPLLLLVIRAPWFSYLFFG